MWNGRGHNMSKMHDIPSSEKETWSSQVGDFFGVGLGSSSQSKSMTDNSESKNKDKSTGEKKKLHRMKSSVMKKKLDVK